MDFLGRIAGFWHYFAATLSLLLAIVVSIHAILYKRDSRAALLWVGVIWLVPLVGGILYLGLGINRIRRRALFLRSGLVRIPGGPLSQARPPVPTLPVMAAED